MKKRGRNTAESTVRARHSTGPPVSEEAGEPMMKPEDFDRAMRGLLAVPWKAKDWRDKRKSHK